ncbi:MAG: thioredoxin [Clostridia bacterium]|nr:thioredoxin [Clostridia bacterium]
MKFFSQNKKASVLILLGILSIAFGIYRGEIATVFHKAVVICLECIGIG